MDFRNSCTEDVQPLLTRGLALVHHMTYEHAYEAFSAAMDTDPDCAMAHWGKGYATEAARARLQYGFEKFGFEHVISLIHPDNVRSIRVAERLGEKYERPYELLGKTVGIYGISNNLS